MTCQIARDQTETNIAITQIDKRKVSQNYDKKKKKDSQGPREVIEENQEKKKKKRTINKINYFIIFPKNMF